LLIEWQGHKNYINKIELDSSETHLITCSDDGMIKLWMECNPKKLKQHDFKLTINDICLYVDSKLFCCVKK